MDNTITKMRYLRAGIVALAIIAFAAILFLLVSMVQSALLADDLVATDFGNITTDSQVAVNLQMVSSALVLLIAAGGIIVLGLALRAARRRRS